MTSDRPIDHRLLEPLLREVDEAERGPPGEHPDEETLALFADGALEERERDGVIDHLARCAECRRAAAVLLSLPGETAAVRPAPDRLHFTRRRAIWIAVAAAALAVIGLFWLVPIDRRTEVAENRVYDNVSTLLSQGEFHRAEEALDRARAEGIRSDRLRSLQSQAILEIPGPVALASAGRLSDFGFEIGGVAARSPTAAEVGAKRQAAYELLAESKSADREVRLNRGNVLLLLGREDEALDVFEELAAEYPEDPLARLGQGIALFMREEYEAAEEAFRNVLDRDPGNVSAKINLAMTLEEQGELQEALAVWESLPETRLSETERRHITEEIDELRRHLGP